MSNNKSLCLCLVLTVLRRRTSFNNSFLFLLGFITFGVHEWSWVLRCSWFQRMPKLKFEGKIACACFKTLTESCQKAGALPTSLNKLEVFGKFDWLILNFCVSTGATQPLAVKIKAKWVGFDNFIAYGYAKKTARLVSQTLSSLQLDDILPQRIIYS